MNERLTDIPEGTLYRELPEPNPSFDFDAIIVHGKNWRRYPLKLRLTHKIRELLKKEKPLPLRPSKDTRLAALGIGEMWRAFVAAGKKPPIFIFSTGKTRGPNNPSEAEVMVRYLKLRYPEIPDDNIVLEDRSYDTVGNIQESKRIIEERGLRNVGYVTVGYHIPRVHLLMNFYDAPINVIFPSEQWAARRSPRHRELVEQYRDSGEWSLHEFGETLLSAETLVDPGQILLSHTLAKLIRHQ